MRPLHPIHAQMVPFVHRRLDARGLAFIVLLATKHWWHFQLGLGKDWWCLVRFRHKNNKVMFRKNINNVEL